MKADNKSDGLHVIEWSAQNFMRLEAIRVRPGGGAVEITGKNDAGKTSAITAIAWAIGGKEFAQEMPLRKGQDRGEVVVDLDELKVTKSMARDGGDVVSTLSVTNRDGSRPRQPQHILDDLRGKMLDPLAFARAKGAERIAMVKSLLPSFDFAGNEKARKEVFQQRTDVNRDHKREIAARDTIDLPKEPRPTAIDVTAATEELRKAIAHNQEIDVRARNRQRAEDDAEAKRDEAARLRAKARELDAEAEALERKVANAGELPAKIDLAELTSRVTDSERVNSKVRQFERWDAHNATATALADKARELTNRLEQIDAEKSQALAGLALPFAGLTVGEDDVRLDDVPFEQIAFSKRLRVSTAIGIALKPRLRVFLIREFGSLLDDESWKQLHEDAAAADMQVIIETTNKDGPGKVVIEDGRVRA
jgi:DNA repair exonuclease SbcCD ATPase subunit